MISYFTLGFGHAHRANGITLDHNIVVAIEGDSARHTREQMFEFFGDKWAFQYDNEPPDMSYFPRGIYNITRGEMI